MSCTHRIGTERTSPSTAPIVTIQATHRRARLGFASVILTIQQRRVVRPLARVSRAVSVGGARRAVVTRTGLAGVRISFRSGEGSTERRSHARRAAIGRKRALRQESDPAAPVPASANEVVLDQAAPGPFATPSRQVVPVWLANLAALGWRVLASVALAAVVLYAAFVLGAVTASVVIAVIVAAAFTPTFLGFRARGWSKMRAALAVTLGVVGGVVLVLVIIILAFVPVVVDLLAAITAGIDRVAADLASAGLSSDVTGSVSEGSSEAAAWLIEGLTAVASSAAVFFTVLILAGFLIFFLMLDGDRAWQWASQSMSPSRRGPFVDSATTAFARIAGYLRDISIVSTAMALYVVVVLSILGVPYAAALAVVAFLGGFIPYFGVIVAEAIILLVVYGTTDARTALIVLGLLIVANLLRDRILSPRDRARPAHRHPPGGGARRGSCRRGDRGSCRDVRRCPGRRARAPDRGSARQCVRAGT